MYNFYNYVIVVTVSPLSWPLMSDTDHIKKLEANRLTPLPKKCQIQDFKLGVVNTDATDIIWKIDAISERWQQMKTEKSHGQTYLIWKKVKLAGAFLVWGGGRPSHSLGPSLLKKTNSQNNCVFILQRAQNGKKRTRGLCSALAHYGGIALQWALPRTRCRAETLGF